MNESIKKNMNEIQKNKLSNEYLTQQQIDHINKLLNDNEQLIDWFNNKLASLKIENARQIPAKWFSDVCYTINNKIKELNIQS